jgi:ADP-ribosylation factor 1/2
VPVVKMTEDDDDDCDGDRGKRVETVPTVGFNTEEIRHDKYRFIMWDIGGQKKIRKLWKHYVESADALIFVVDAQDRKRLKEARGAFKK